MYREKLFKCPLYPIRICLIVSDNFLLVNKKYDLELTEDSFAHTARNYIQIKGEVLRAVCVFMCFDPEFEFEQYRLCPSLIAHECFHASGFIMEHIGILPENFNNEGQAYLLGYLMDETMKFLKPYMKDGKAK